MQLLDLFALLPELSLSELTRGTSAAGGKNAPTSSRSLAQGDASAPVRGGSSGPLPLLKAGARLVARVVAKGPQTLELEVDGQRLTARTHQPLEVGDRVLIEVVKEGRPAEAKVVAADKGVPQLAEAAARLVRIRANGLWLLPRLRSAIKGGGLPSPVQMAQRDDQQWPTGQLLEQMPLSSQPHEKEIALLFKLFSPALAETATEELPAALKAMAAQITQGRAEEPSPPLQTATFTPDQAPPVTPQGQMPSNISGQTQEPIRQMEAAPWPGAQPPLNQDGQVVSAEREAPSIPSTPPPPSPEGGVDGPEPGLPSPPEALETAHQAQAVRPAGPAMEDALLETPRQRLDTPLPAEEGGGADAAAPRSGTSSPSPEPAFSGPVEEPPGPAPHHPTPKGVSPPPNQESETGRLWQPSAVHRAAPDPAAQALEGLAHHLAAPAMLHHFLSILSELPVLIIPFWFQDGSLLGHLISWEEGAGEEGQREGRGVRHLFFQLELDRIGPLSIDVLQRDDGVGITVYASPDALEEVESSLPLLSDSLQSGGFSVLWLRACSISGGTEGQNTPACWTVPDSHLIDIET